MNLTTAGGLSQRITEACCLLIGKVSNEISLAFNINKVGPFPLIVSNSWILELLTSLNFLKVNKVCFD